MFLKGESVKESVIILNGTEVLKLIKEYVVNTYTDHKITWYKPLEKKLLLMALVDSISSVMNVQVEPISGLNFSRPITTHTTLYTEIVNTVMYLYGSIFLNYITNDVYIDLFVVGHNIHVHISEVPNGQA